ncbi:MAG: HAD family hydrolase [Bacillota bacterium]|nr:HAD family hydrolase [Bacillota bacterium]
MKQYDVYLLDFDGTTFDTSESLFPVFLHGFEAIGKKCTPEDAREYMHHSLPQAAKMANLSEEELTPWAEEICRALDYEDSLSLIKIFPETFEVVSKLHSQGKKLGIVTGNLSDHVRKILGRFGLDSAFPVIVGSDVYKKSKPDREPIDIALRMLGVDGASAVYVGDSLQDIECGHNAGIDAILVDRNDEHPDFGGEKIKSLRQLFSCD